jgi:hypothetical protein
MDLGERLLRIFLGRAREEVSWVALEGAGEALVHIAADNDKLAMSNYQNCSLLPFRRHSKLHAYDSNLLGYYRNVSEKSWRLFRNEGASESELII